MSDLAHFVVGIGVGLVLVTVPRSSVYGNFRTLTQDSTVQDSTARGRGRCAPPPTTPAVAQVLQVPVTGRALPWQNTPTFVGAFSSYPYFRNGVVAVSSTLEGLFLVRYRPAAGAP